jgi:hypothetical protein
VDEFVYEHYQRVMLMILKDMGWLRVRIVRLLLLVCCTFASISIDQLLAQVYIHGDQVQPYENAIYMSNHQVCSIYICCNRYHASNRNHAQSALAVIG